MKCNPCICTLKSSEILTIEEIIERSNIFFDLDVKRKIRKREYVQARQMTMHLLYFYFKNKVEVIAPYFGKDQSTVTHSKKAIRNIFETEPDILEYYFKYKKFILND